MGIEKEDTYASIPLVERDSSDGLPDGMPDSHQAQMTNIHTMIHGDDSPHVRENPLTTTRLTPYLCAISLVVSLGLIFLPLGILPLFAIPTEELPLISDVEFHLENFYGIAAAHGGSRSVTKGFNASADYILANLTGAQDFYTTSTQPFSLPVFELAAPPHVSTTTAAGDHAVWLEGEDYGIMTYSASKNYATLPVVHVADFGCVATDYTMTTKPAAALVSRGECTFGTKAALARAHGYPVVLVHNNQAGLLVGTLGDPVDALVVGITQSRGQELIADASIVVNVNAETIVRTDYTMNVIADSVHGSKSNVIVIGAHLDSVDAGPGINDNASGSAMLLALARFFISQKYEPINAVRFAWWGAEELGLKGSTHYVNDLVSRDLTSDVALYLNFDMIASPNYKVGIYSAEMAPEAVKAGVAALEGLLGDTLRNMSVTPVPLEFNGRSDYGPFVEAGIPANGVETGAEGIKTEEERKLFGGLMDAAYDTCYHKQCDDVENANTHVLETNLVMAARVVYKLMFMDDVRGFLSGERHY